MKRKATLKDKIKFLEKNNWKHFGRNSIKYYGMRHKIYGYKLSFNIDMINKIIKVLYPNAWKRYKKDEGLK